MEILKTNTKPPVTIVITHEEAVEIVRICGLLSTDQLQKLTGVVPKVFKDEVYGMKDNVLANLYYLLEKHVK